MIKMLNKFLDYFSDLVDLFRDGMVFRMARFSELEVEIECDSVVPLGQNTHVGANLSNLICNDFGSYITLKCETPFGVYPIMKLLRGGIQHS